MPHISHQLSIEKQDLKEHDCLLQQRKATELFQVRDYIPCSHERLFSTIVCPQGGDVQGAVDSLIECSRLNPEHATSQWNVGVLLARVEDYENALSWMEEALRLNSTSISYLKGIGTTALKAGR